MKTALGRAARASAAGAGQTACVREDRGGARPVAAVQTPNGCMYVTAAPEGLDGLRPKLHASYDQGIGLHRPEPRVQRKVPWHEDSTVAVGV